MNDIEDAVTTVSNKLDGYARRRKPKREPQPGDIRFMDLAREMGLMPSDLARMRSEHLCEMDFYEIGLAKWFTAAGADKLRLAVEIPLVVPKRVKARVIHGAPNPNWVYAAIEGREGKHAVAIPRKLRGKLVGKHIYVDCIKDGTGGESFRHELLTGA